MKSKDAGDGEVFVQLLDVHHCLFDYLLDAGYQFKSQLDLRIRGRTKDQVRGVTDYLLKAKP